MRDKQEEGVEGGGGGRGRTREQWRSRKRSGASAGDPLMTMDVRDGTSGTSTDVPWRWS